MRLYVSFRLESTAISANRMRSIVSTKCHRPPLDLSASLAAVVAAAFDELVVPADVLKRSDCNRVYPISISSRSTDEQGLITHLDDIER